jgi:hypothetical protein
MAQILYFVYLLFTLYNFIINVQEMDPLGVLCLQGYTSCLAPELTVQQPYAFKLAKPGAGIKYLAAKDSETVNQWVDAINQRAFRLNKVYDCMK